MDNEKDGASEWEVGEEPKNVKNITIKVVREKGSRTTSSSSSSSNSFCQADECGMNLNMAKSYNRRHKVCERHAKAPVVLVSSIRQRFCQQCSKFHEVAEFDDNKRSCRLTLAGHNERRRKARIDLSLRNDDINITHHTHISSD